MLWCCLLATFRSAQHQGEYTDPAHQPLLAIFYEGKKIAQMSKDGNGTVPNQNKAPHWTLCRASLRSKKKGHAGGESMWATLRHNKHFWHISSIFFPLKIKSSSSFSHKHLLASYKDRKCKIVSLWEKVKWNYTNWVTWLKLPKSSQKGNLPSACCPSVLLAHVL